MADIARIKGNISKMIAQNAPEADIDAYVSSEGITVDQLRTASPAPPDKYQQAAIEEDKAIGGAPNAGFTRRLTHGATLGADNTIIAGLSTPLEMIKRGTMDPSEAYNYAKAREDLIMNKSREKTGVLGTVAEVLGGGVAGAGIGSSALSAGRLLAPEAGLLARSGASAVDAAAIGGFTGAMEGNGIEERAANAGKSALAGALLGGAAPGVISAAGAVARPVLSNIAARRNPAQYAEGQVSRAIQEGTTPIDDLTAQMGQAAREGQPQFTLADAMGNSGQRMLSSVARSPGPGRTAVVEALENRQAGQGRRVTNALSEGFGSRMTPDQMRAAMTAERRAIADDAYGAVRNDSNPVNLTGPINNLDRNIGTQPGQQLVAPNDSIEATLRGFRERLARVNPDDFEAVQRIRGEMSDAAQAALQSGYGNRARLIRQNLAELDNAMEGASPGFRQANRDFAGASGNIDAIDLGRTAAMRGRTEDTIPAFQALPPRGQQAFRTGYVDPLVAQTQGAASGVNKARPLINDAFRDEAAAIAPGNALMQRRLGREQTMFETRNTALGGSKTADNLNDDAAMAVSPEILMQALSGNIGGAARSLLLAGQNVASGNTAEVRRHIAAILLQNGRSVSPAALRGMVDRTVERLRRAQDLARSLGRGAVGGGFAGAPSGPSNRRN